MAEFGGENEKYSEYAIFVKGGWRRPLISEDIGEDLSEYFDKTKDEVEPMSIPFYKKNSFKIFIGVILAIIFALLFTFFVMFPAIEEEEILISLIISIS
ncbi:MAG: hypothetical protein KGY76_06230 [Candidatus Thermoplasmatota archaeon]|nr:hypothetical protein [Candidatus Thermoplasmatota archaeon]